MPIFISIREAKQGRQAATHKLETYLLLCLVRFIGRRFSSPAAAHDCEPHYINKSIIIWRNKKMYKLGYYNENGEQETLRTAKNKRRGKRKV